MASREKGPCDQEDELQFLLKKEERKELQKITSVNRERFLTLEKLLNDAYVACQPEPNEYQHRKNLVHVFNEIARELYGNGADCPIVEEFGSFTMGLSTTESDLDLSINFSNYPNVYPRGQIIATLRRFKKKLYALQDEGLFCDVQPIMHAKVPILKVVDVATGIECDLSVENRDGISKSKIIYLISSLDARFQKLCILMKAWAKAHDINSSKDRTLSSLSIVLLVAFHLQTRDPPILPPFSAILKEIVEGEDLEMVEKYVESFENYGIRNTESLGELFVSFLIKLESVAQFWPKGVCASTYHGRWISKTWNNGIASISVEDFTDHTQNVARAVGKREVDQIYRHIELAIHSLGSFMNGSIKESELRDSLFGNSFERKIRQAHPPVKPKHETQGVTMNKPTERRHQHVTTTNPHSTMKRVLMSDGWEAHATQDWTTRRPHTVGYWRPRQNQAMSSNSALPTTFDATPKTPHVLQPVMAVESESAQNMQESGFKLGRITSATQVQGGPRTGGWGGLGWGQDWEGPTIGDCGGLGWGQSWEGPSTGTWGGIQGASPMHPPHISRGVQPMEDRFGTKIQQLPPGASFFSCGPPFHRNSSSK